MSRKLGGSARVHVYYRPHPVDVPAVSWWGTAAWML